MTIKLHVFSSSNAQESLATITADSLLEAYDMAENLRNDGFVVVTVATPN